MSATVVLATGSVPVTGESAESTAVARAGALDCVPALAAGSQTLILDVGGDPREVIVHLPSDEAPVRRPAVIAFHGYSSYAKDLESVSGLSTMADEEGFVVAYPQALGSPTEWHFAGNFGYDQRDVLLTHELITLLVEQGCADPDRVVLAGHSMGGGMASDAACRSVDEIAGVVLVAALWFELPCEPVRPIPVVAMHALDDEILPYAGGPIADTGPGVPDQLPVEIAVATWAERDGCGPTPQVVVASDGGALLTWPDCAVQVELHRLPQGGHAWPAIASSLITQMLATR